MIADDLSPSHEAPRDFVVLRQDATVTIQDAFALAINENLPIGKSTIQRWAKSWSDQGTTSPVKCVLVTTRTGASYQLDRDDFLSWLIEQKQNTRPGNVLQDPERSHEILKGPMRSQQISRGPERPSETSRDFQDPGPSEPGQIADLRNEIMNLKIDVGIRKELVNQAAGEINRLRQLNESLLVEKGALQFQLLQLAAPVTVTRPIPHEYRSTIESSEGQGKEPHNSGSVDNSTS